MTNPNKASDTFYILDFDRCIGDTNALFSAFEKTIVDHTGLTAATLQNVRHEVEAVGDSFDTATYVRAQLHLEKREDKWRDLENDFVASCDKKDMLLPGARKLITWLGSHNLPYGTVTYGEETWQKLKLRAAGLGEMPQLITTNKHKGSLFQTWRHNDEFKIPSELGGGAYSSLVLIDDKAVSFDNFPSYPSHGYWVVDKANMLPSQEGSVPSNVQNYASLAEVLKVLDHNIDKA